MLADFCLRLALGMTAVLFLLSPTSTARPAPGRKPLTTANFFRTQLLVTLAFTVGALLWLWPSAAWPVLACLLAAAILALLGSVTWMLERSPGGIALILLTTLALSAALVFHERASSPEGEARQLLGAFSSAALLGAAISAMLMGHNYLIAPAMSLTPLYRLLAALAVTLALRVGVDGFTLLRWTAGHSLANLSGDAVLWLPVRWLVGLAAPAVLCWMAWKTAQIRSTQSATGILYVCVIFCFLGELTGQLLRPAGLTL